MKLSKKEIEALMLTIFIATTIKETEIDHINPKTKKTLMQIYEKLNNLYYEKPKVKIWHHE